MRMPSTIARYEIRSLLSRGGMGAVYLAFDPQLERHVAVKVLRDDLDTDLARARFLREARAAASLRHPNIVTIYDCGVHEGHPYLAMEYLPGETLAAVLVRRPPLPLARRLAIGEDLCSAVAHAHRMHLVHRDIKPGNVMIDADGVVKVLDFGLVRTAESAITRDGVVVGTLNYMAPEQLAGAPVDHRADVFSTGAVLYELLALRPAFAGTMREGVMLRILHLGPEPLERVCPDLDPELYAVARRALARSPDERYQSLASLGADLLRIRTRLSGELERAPSECDPAGAGDLRDVETLKLQAATRAASQVRRGTHGSGTRTRRSRGATVACAGVACLSLTFVGPQSTKVGTPGTAHPLVSRHPLATPMAPLPGPIGSPRLLGSHRPRAAEPRRPVIVPETLPTIRSKPRIQVAPAPPPAVAPDALEPAHVPEAPRVQAEDVEADRPSPPVPREPDASEAIRQVLREYVEAMSARDVDRLSAVLRMDAATRSRHEAILREYDELSMRLLRIDAPRVVADRAFVRCVIQETVAHGGRRSSPGPSDVEVSLVRSAGRWTISGIRGR